MPTKTFRTNANATTSFNTQSGRCGIAPLFNGKSLDSRLTQTGSDSINLLMIETIFKAEVLLMSKRLFRLTHSSLTASRKLRSEIQMYRGELRLRLQETRDLMSRLRQSVRQSSMLQKE